MCSWRPETLLTFVHVNVAFTVYMKREASSFLVQLKTKNDDLFVITLRFNLVCDLSIWTILCDSPLSRTWTECRVCLLNHKLCGVSYLNCVLQSHHPQWPGPESSECWNTVQSHPQRVHHERCGLLRSAGTSPTHLFTLSSGSQAQLCVLCLHGGTLRSNWTQWHTHTSFSRCRMNIIRIHAGKLY